MLLRICPRGYSVSRKGEASICMKSTYTGMSKSTLTWPYHIQASKYANQEKFHLRNFKTIDIFQFYSQWTFA